MKHATAIYARTSRRSQNPENQARQLRAWCRANGYEIAGEFIDQARASARLRPGLQAILRAAQSGEFDQVIVTRWDRIARDWQQLRAIMGALKGAGVTVLAVADPLQPEAAMEAASLETRVLSSRVRDGLDRARGEGRRVGRPPRSRPDQGAQPSRLAQRLAMAAGGIRQQWESPW